MKPKIIDGNIFKDSRGIMHHTKDFTLENVCRFYTIGRTDIKTVRAWRGHKLETKYFVPIKDKFIVAWVKIDNFDNPNRNLKADYKILGDNEPLVLHIPPGYANGLGALAKNSIIGVFSDMENEKSVKEKIRYPSEWWFDWFQDFKEIND